MWLSFKVFCTCQCSYTIGENISTDKITCPNCGLEHPYSDKLIAILKIADSIPGHYSEDDVKTISIPNP